MKLASTEWIALTSLYLYLQHRWYIQYSRAASLLLPRIQPFMPLIFICALGTRARILPQRRIEEGLSPTPKNQKMLVEKC
jgi:hypothetical protein